MTGPVLSRRSSPMSTPRPAPTAIRGGPRARVRGIKDLGVRKVGDARQEARRSAGQSLKEQRQGSETTRKYLSEPPLDYRQAAATAPQDDIGEDECVKERAAKKAARKPGSRKWADWLPF